MAEPITPAPVLLVVAAFSKHMAALEWACERLQKEFGPIALQSPCYEFNQTSYYESTMGRNLRKQFLVFHDLAQPACLPEMKLRTNAFENELAETRKHAEPRPLNLDPGLLTLGKFLLATTKDQAHRIYLGMGIFAEVTLRFQAGAFEPWPWTYADYRQPCVISFLGEAREFYRRRLRDT
jgi:Domain of unknown function (DUF4416)